MNNIKEYIASGNVESYVLGLSSTEERIEFEKLCVQHEDILLARTSFEIALEKLLFSQAIAPAVEVKDKVMDAIRHPSAANQAKVISMENANTYSGSSSIRWVAAAAIVLLLVSGYFAYSFYTKTENLKAELARTKTDQQDLDKKLKTLEMVSDPNVAVVNLKGTEKAPRSSASIYWDSTSSNVYLVAKNMPKLPSEQQYQLWSLINGQDGNPQPTSLGLFDVGEDGKIILKMENATKADAFAITIETRGNKGGPTLEQLQTMGKTSL